MRSEYGSAVKSLSLLFIILGILSIFLTAWLLIPLVIAYVIILVIHTGLTITKGIDKVLSKMDEDTL